MRGLWRLRTSVWALGAAALAAIFLAHCNGGVPLTATEGAELSISANPTAIPVIGGISTITVVGFKSAEDGGGPLPDGTQIFFTTDVGVIEERVEMQNGVARGSLRSNGRAGLATVAARSGAGIEALLEDGVLIGNAEGINILLTANPPTVTSPDFTTDLVATVFDNDNNRMPGVPLIFTASAGALASQGSTLRTNELGQATDRLTLLNENNATVTAFSGAVTSNQVTVSRGAGVNPVITSVFPSSGLPGDSLTVTIRGLNFQPGAAVSFGDGVGVSSVTFVDSTTLIANITIDPGATSRERTVTVTNPDGTSGSLANGFRVGLSAPPVINTVSPTSGAQNTQDLMVTITGQDFQPGATVSFGPGITFDSVTVNNSMLITVVIDIDQFAATGPRDVTVTNPDGGQDTVFDGFTVT